MNKKAIAIKYMIPSMILMALTILIFLAVEIQAQTKTSSLSDSNYSYYSKEYKSQEYNIYFRNNTNTANGIRFERNGYYFIYDISGSEMRWRATPTKPDATNTLGGGVSSNSQDTQVQVNGNKVTYPNAFSNTNLTYTLSKRTIKENFILYSLPSIKDYLYLEYTGHIYFNKSLNICANGQCYTPSGTQDNFNTSGKIYFKDSSNRTQFYLNDPLITDSAGNSVLGVYVVRGSNAQMEYAIRIPTSFIINATFPLFIDPTIIIIPPAEHLNETFGFIEDIYNRINALDDNVSLIPNNHYINLTFEIPLDKTKDITIYAKSNTSLSSVEIYLQNSTLITTISNISNGSISQYQALLENLNEGESYSSFLLKIIGDLIIDYIVDPVVFTFISPTPIDGAGITTNSFPTNVSIYDDCLGGGIIPTWYLDGVINYTEAQLPLCEDPTTYYYNYTYTDLSEGNHTYYFIGGESGDTATRTIYYDIINPNINFTNPPPSNASTQSANSIYVNISSNDSSPHFVLNQFDNSLVSWWRMDDINASGDPVDYFGRNNASKKGTAVQNYGQYGKGFDLDGKGYLKVNNIPFNANTDLSIFAWIVPTNIGGGEQQPLHFKGDNSITRIQLYKPNNSPNLILLVNGGCIGGSITATGVLANNIWTHVGYTRVANYSGYYSNFTFYVNGINKGTRLCNGTFETTTTDLWIGSESGNTLNWTGVMDEVVLYNRSISPTEINSLMNATNNQYYNNFTRLSDGNHTFRGYVVDKAGNLNSTELRTVAIDATFPTFSNNKTDLTASTILGSNVYFNITITEASPSSYIFSWYNGTNWENSTSTYTNGQEINITKTINIDAGDINWTWYANDSAGNINQSQVYRITLTADDSIPPNVTVVYPVNGSYYSLTSLTFNLSVVDNVAVSSCWYSLNSGVTNYTMSNTTSTSWNATNSSIGNGVYTAKFYCNDTNNNINNTEQVTFTIDTIKPAINFTSPTETSGSSISRSNILINVTSTDSGSGLKNITIYLYNSTTLINSTNSTTSPLFINFTNLADGVYYFNSTAYDNAGNKNSIETRNVTIDTVISIPSPSPGGPPPTSSIIERVISNFTVEYVSPFSSNVYNSVKVYAFDKNGTGIDLSNLTVYSSVNVDGEKISRIKAGEYLVDLLFTDYVGNLTLSITAFKDTPITNTINVKVVEISFFQQKYYEIVRFLKTQFNKIYLVLTFYPIFVLVCLFVFVILSVILYKAMK